MPQVAICAASEKRGNERTRSLILQVWRDRAASLRGHRQERLC